MRRPQRVQPPAWKTWDKPLPADDLWSWQDGRCAWCGSDRGSKFVQDHCHRTGLIRGLLCGTCNTREGHGGVAEWDAWRNGDNTAYAIGHFEIYRHPWYGHTEIRPGSPLMYYTAAEQEAWFDLIIKQLSAAEIDWPTDAPWSEAALERQADAMRQTNEAMANFFKDIPWLSGEPKSAS